MFRIALPLCLLPLPALAQWSPMPRAFSYDATFAQCTLDPARVDAADCDVLLRGAFDLNIAVTHAVTDCGDASLAECAAPFDTRGLPAIAARIAADARCDRSDLAGFAPFTPLPEDHCITMISDILRDEGVVPIDAPTTCLTETPDCLALREIHAGLWASAIKDMSDTPMMRMRFDASWNACFELSTVEADILACHAETLAAIWADLMTAQ